MAKKLAWATTDRTYYVYYPHTQVTPDNVTAKVLNRAHSVTANVEIPRGGAKGVLISQILRGENAGGCSLFIQDGKLHFVHIYEGAEEFHVASANDVPVGRVALRFSFEPTGKPGFAKGRGAPRRVQFYFNGTPAGQRDIPTLVPLVLSMGEDVCVGRDPGLPATSRYAPPFAFTGWIHSVTVDVSGKLIKEKESC